MAHLLEFSGRVVRPAGRTSAGPMDLHISIHSSPVEGVTLWEETLADVHVSVAGTFDCVLGLGRPLTPGVFRSIPVWVAVRVARPGERGEELVPRVPLTGNTLLLADDVWQLEQRVARVETSQGITPPPPTPPPTVVDPAGRPAAAPPLASDELGRRVLKLHRRLKRIEAGKGAIAELATKLEDLAVRLHRVDHEDGRLVRLEDEIEDLTGPDGDLIDIIERLEKLEGSGPVARREPERPPPGRADLRAMAQINELVEGLRGRMEAVEERLARTPVATADSLHVVKRGGDTMTGGLTINRGGLDVVAGGIKCRGADVGSLEATVHVRAPKLITDALELRGDLTTDSTRHALQIRHVEGRSSAGRKDGVLMLNTRSGEEVVVGNDEGRAGMTVHGPVHADGVTTRAGGSAWLFDAEEALAPGDVVAVLTRGRVGRTSAAGQREIVGVVVEQAAWVAGTRGEGKVTVALGGVVRCHTVGEVHPGDLLQASAQPGRACKAVPAADGRPEAGTVLGKALGTAHGDAGEVLVLLTPGV